MEIQPSGNEQSNMPSRCYFLSLYFYYFISLYIIYVYTSVTFPVCGRPTKQINEIQRIIGGSDAPEHTIPWQVLINTVGRGGGAVIADRWILTAAHMLMSNGQKVPVSSVNVSSSF